MLTEMPEVKEIDQYHQNKKSDMSSLHSMANVNNPNSFSNRMRNRRFLVFESLIKDLPRPIKMLDVGGTTEYWRRRGWAGNSDYQITLVNMSKEESEYDNITGTVGDATNMSEHPDQSFDIVYSNSVIEHLFTFENQQAMAKEVQRIGRAYWIQTPNYYFPIEPHFHYPGWQWLPVETRIKMLMSRRCGQRGPIPEREKAEEMVKEIRLMKGREMRQIFPKATLYKERFFGLVKSFVAHEGLGPKS